MSVTQSIVSTLNIQSLGHGTFGVRKRAELRDFLDKQIPKTGVLLLQEHHLSLDNCLHHTQQLEHKGGAHFWNSDSYTALGDRFSGGTGILVAPLFTPFIVDHRVVIDSRAQFIMLEIYKMKIGILNIYTPNLPG